MKNILFRICLKLVILVIIVFVILQIILFDSFIILEANLFPQHLNKSTNWRQRLHEYFIHSSRCQQITKNNKMSGLFVSFMWLFYIYSSIFFKLLSIFKNMSHSTLVQCSKYSLFKRYMYYLIFFYISAFLKHTLYHYKKY